MTGRVIQGFFLGRGPLPNVAPPSAPTPLQRKEAPGHPHLAHQMVHVAQPHRAPIQRFGAGDVVEIDPARVGLVRYGGSPLPAALLAKMEGAFGANFSNVRVHVGPQASRIGALAFTIGNDVYFAPGQFQPDSPRGQELIGHELAHVVQQRQGRVRAPGNGVAVVQDRGLEAEADRMGARAAAFPAPVLRALASPGTPPAHNFGAALQRQKRGRHSDKAYSKDGDFHSNSSDSDTDIESPTKKVKFEVPVRGQKGVKKEMEKPRHEVVFNHTKRSGRQKSKGQWITRRDRGGKRTVERVDNRVYLGSFPDLAAHAKQIHDAIPAHEKESFAATSVICAVLLDRNDKYRKYCFTNLDRTVRGDISAEAKALGYHVVVAPASHAEAEMIQYTHVYRNVKLVSIGCDKEHCSECNHLMATIYNGVNTATRSSKAVFKNYHYNEILKEATGLKERPSKDLGWTKKGGERTDRGEYDPTPAQVVAITNGNGALVRITPDGDCLYQALVTAGRATSVRALRTALGAEIRNNTIDVEGWGTPGEIATKIETMRSFDHDVGDYTPELLARHLNIQIRIINENGMTTRIGESATAVTLVRVTFPLPHYHLVR